MITFFGVTIAIESIYHILIIFLSLMWILALFISCWRHRARTNFSSIILRTDEHGYSRVSKIGILFCFCLILIVVQTVTPGMTLDPQLVMLTTIALGTELTRQGMQVAMTYFANRKPREYDRELDGNIARPYDFDGRPQEPIRVSRDRIRDEEPMPADIPLHGPCEEK